LAILNFRYNSSGDSPHWEVLVQWQGLSPNETSWEDWSQLRQDYHLEDKVISQRPQNDRETKVQGVASSGPSEVMNTGVQLEEKPKRIITKPAYLKDYV